MKVSPLVMVISLGCTPSSFIPGGTARVGGGEHRAKHEDARCPRSEERAGECQHQRLAQILAEINVVSGMQATVVDLAGFFCITHGACFASRHRHNCLPGPRRP